MNTINMLLQGRTPGQLIVQLTDRCNGQCPQCEMRASSPFSRSRLSVDDCRRIIDRAAPKGVQALSITGGEPLLYLDDLIQIVQHAGNAGIKYIRSGTNGFIFADPSRAHFLDRVKRIAERLAATPIRNFWISIDSADPGTHDRMRGFCGLFKGIEKSLPIFHEFGLYPTANLGLNRNITSCKQPLPSFGQDMKEVQQKQLATACGDGLQRFFSRVIDLGFSIVNFCYPMSVDGGGDLAAVYPASSADRIVRFSLAEKGILFQAMLDTLPHYRSRLRIFSPRSVLHSLAAIGKGFDLRPFPCRGGHDYFFINAADGDTYPCGYRGTDNLGRYGKQSAHLTPDDNCSRCDWECFRDPSEFFGPLRHVLRQPAALVTTYHRSAEFYRLWFEDLRYYRACDYFNGRMPINPKKLQPFSPKTALHDLRQTESISPVAR